MEILTTPIVEGRRISEYKGLVLAKNVRAVNIIRDKEPGSWRYTT